VGQQFGCMDSPANRKAVMDLVKRAGGNLGELLEARRRAHILQSLAGQSPSLGHLPIQIAPCSPVEGYFLYSAITGVLGVDAEKAAVALEEVVRGS